jgi:glycosyltransferase involved in cell wall biosynthesis
MGSRVVRANLANMQAKSIAVVQPAVPDYRVPLFQALAERYGPAFAVYAAAASGGGTIRTDDRARTFVRPLSNMELLGGRLLWQRGYEQELLDAALVIAPGSLRFLSVRWLLTRRKLRGLPTILWGHFAGSWSWAAFPRRGMFRLPNGYIAYTQTDGEKIRRIRGDDRVWVASNSCVWKDECRAASRPGITPQDVLYVGRLVADKKPSLLLEGFARAVGRGAVPQAARLVIVGDGPLRADLQARAAVLGVGQRTVFTGHVSDHGTLEELYAGALVAASPGYIGLSAIQSFAAGVPMIVSRTEKHSPEIEACEESFNTVFFETDSIESLASHLAAAYAAADEWTRRRPLIAGRIAAKYTYDGMIAAFETAIDAFI